MAEGAARSILHQLYTQKPKTVCIVGSGNWGSTAAKIIGENILSSEAGQIFAQEGKDSADSRAAHDVFAHVVSSAV